MKVYLLSPESVPMNPHLFPMFIPTWKEQGVEIVDRIEDCEIVFFDLHSRIAHYDQNVLEGMLRKQPFVVLFDEFDKGGMSELDYPYPLTPQMWHCISALKSHIGFCRLLNRTKEYQNVFPFEKPILHEEPMLSADELFNREYDIVFIANTAPQREAIASVLRTDARFKCKIILGAEKIPFTDWVNEHKRGKMFVKWSAGGYGCEKMHNLFSIAAMIKEDNDQLFAHPFTNSVNCVTLSTVPTKQELDYLRLVVGNKEELYKIYTGCYEFMKKYYSKEYIAKDILSKISKHLAAP